MYPNPSFVRQRCVSCGILRCFRHRKMIFVGNLEERLRGRNIRGNITNLTGEYMSISKVTVVSGFLKVKYKLYSRTVGTMGPLSYSSFVSTTSNQLAAVITIVRDSSFPTATRNQHDHAL